MVIDEADDLHDRLQVLLHIGHFHIADGPARRQRLEFRLQLQLVKGVDGLCHMHMVAVGNISLIRYARDDAEAPLQAFGELIGCALQGRAVQAVVNVLGLFPLAGVLVELAHNL